MREPLCNNCGLASRPAGRGWAPLAHAWLEQRTHNPLVPCSTHGGGTIRALAIPMRTSSETASDTRLCRIAAIRRLPPLIRITWPSSLRAECRLGSWRLIFVGRHSHPVRLPDCTASSFRQSFSHGLERPTPRAHSGWSCGDPVAGLEELTPICRSPPHREYPVSSRRCLVTWVPHETRAPTCFSPFLKVKFPSLTAETLSCTEISKGSRHERPTPDRGNLQGRALQGP